MNNAVISTMYTNGMIKNNAGNLIGFFDAEESIVYVDGIADPIKVIDAEHAHDVVGENYREGGAA